MRRSRLDIAQRNPPRKHERLSFKDLSSIIGNLSQFLLFMLAIVGYYWTVLPVYQNQKLSEENARLEKQNADLESSQTQQRQQFEEELREKTGRLQEVNSDLEKKMSDYDILKREVDEIRKRTLAEAAALERQKDLELQAKKKSEEDEHLNDLYFGMGREILEKADSRDSRYFNGGDHDFFNTVLNLGPGDIDTFLDKVYVNPVEYVKPQVERLIVKYSALTDDDSKARISKLIQVQERLRDDAMLFVADANAKSAISIRIHVYLNEYKALGAMNYVEKAKASGAFISDIVEYNSKIVDTGDVVGDLFDFPFLRGMGLMHLPFGFKKVKK